MISVCVKKREFVVGTHFKRQNCSKLLDFFPCVEINRGTVGITFKQISRVLRFSIFRLKIEKKMKKMKKSQNCRRKLK